MEQIRGAEFIRRPLPVLVTGAQTRREAFAELDRLSTPAQRAADEELLKLLGLIPPQSNMRDIQSQIYQDQVAGFYDPRTKRLALVRDAAGQGVSVGEITLAHELTHALDDQVYGIRDQPAGVGDANSAYTALVEGDATSVMTRYAQRYMSGLDLVSILASATSESTASLPPYIEATLLFPYVEGQQFVDALVRYARGWKLVNSAFKTRPPLSTQQILHPLDYVRNLKPKPPRLQVRPLLGPAWRRVDAGDLGEFDTRQLLLHGTLPPRAAQIAAAWRGGTFELWRNAPLPSPTCAAPCRPHDSLVLAWRTDTARDATTLGTAVGTFVTDSLGGRSRGTGGWTLPNSAAAVRTNGTSAVMALAPTAAMADSLATAAVRSG
ncbi:MAG TPA: hypothetical protein VH256_03130 [Thermoleophilaceae bacterium]|nr:hypothetical protein [Thermoleophilaceae bacterium]